jgi:hypothetical protein
MINRMLIDVVGSHYAGAIECIAVFNESTIQVLGDSASLFQVRDLFLGGFPVWHPVAAIVVDVVEAGVRHIGQPVRRKNHFAFAAPDRHVLAIWKGASLVDKPLELELKR